jgi:hypothetical protein
VKQLLFFVKRWIKKEFRVLMQHCYLAKKNTVEAKVWVDKHYSDSTLAKSTVEKWFAKLKRGKMSIEDDARTENFYN